VENHFNMTEKSF